MRSEDPIEKVTYYQPHNYRRGEHKAKRTDFSQFFQIGSKILFIRHVRLFLNYDITVNSKIISFFVELEDYKYYYPQGRKGQADLSMIDHEERNLNDSD